MENIRNERRSAGLAAQLAVEHQKIKYRKVWLVPAGVLLMQFLWAAWTFQEADAQRLAQGYSYLFYEMPILNVILMPVLIAVITSRLCDAEVKGDTFKLLFTMQRSGSLYDCKLIFGLRYIFFAVMLQMVMIVGVGKIFGITEKLNYKMAAVYCLTTFIVNVVILIVQQFLSLISTNQILPLSVGLAGAFLGLFSMFFPTSVQKLVLWGYYAIFMPVQMNYNAADKTMSFSGLPFQTGTLIGFIIAGVLIYAVTKKIFIKREV